MGATVVLGKSAWRRARALPDGATWIVGSPREVGPRFGFQPRVYVLDTLLDELYSRFGPGHAVLSQRAAALLAARVLRERVLLADLGSPDHTGAALAALHASAAEAGLRLDDVPADVSEALAAYERALSTIPGRVTRAAALTALLDPSPALRRWLARHRAVVVDGLLQPSPLRRSVLLGLLEAWSRAGTDVVVTFETGRDLGGAEAELFFEYGDCDGVAYALKPFTATRDLRRDVFERLVATGSASVLVALPDRLLTVDPGDVPAPAGPIDLSDAVYAPVHAPPDPRLRVWRCADPDAELRAVARDVKAALLDGASVDDCAVAVVDLAGRVSQVRDAFADAGIPVWIASGTRLATAPVARLVRRVSALAVEGWPTADLVAVLSSDLAAGPDVAGPLREGLAAAGIAAGHPSTWHDRLALVQARGRVLADLPLGPTLEDLDAWCAPLERLGEPATPIAWRDALLGALEHLEVSTRLREADELRAWSEVLARIDTLVADLRSVHDGEWDAADLARALGDALDGATYHPEPPGPQRVAVGPTLVPARHVWVAGLSRGVFPPPPPASFLVPPRLARRLGPDALAHARYALLSAVRNALDDPDAASLVLSWPATRDGRPSSPAPPLHDLLAAGAPVIDVDGATDTPMGRRDLLRAAARDPAWTRWLDPGDRALLAHQRAAHAARSADDAGPWDGILERPPAPPASLPVTAVESFLRCPARYWYDRVLGLREVEAWDADVPADARGRAVHQALERFVLAWDGPLFGADRSEAAAMLYDVASRTLAEAAAEGRSQPVRDHLADEWLAGLVDDRPRGVLAAWLDAEIDAGVRLEPVAVERRADVPLGGLTVRGRLDRLERLPGAGLVVTDYKTGKPPEPDAVRRGLVLQSVAYAAAVRNEHGEPVASAYLDLRRPDVVGRTCWFGPRELLSRLVPRSRLDKQVQAGDAERDALLDHHAASAGRLRAGRFHTTLATEDEAGCGWCPYRRVCRVDTVRNARLARGPGDLQRPLEPSAGEDP